MKLKNEILIPVGGKLILHCNFDTSKLSIYLPSFYKQCFDAWSEVNAKTPSLLHEIANEAVWNTKLLCINKKSVYCRDIADLICDLFSTKENLNPEQGFFIMGIINSMPASWRLTIKRATTAPVIDPLPDSPAILISNNLVPILDASSKQIYRLFLEKKQTTPTAKVKLAAKYSNIDIDWKSVYSLSFRTTLESKRREFKFKILNRIVFTNEKLFRFGMAESPSCAFCQTEFESVEHLLFSCTVSSSFWKHVLSWLRDYNISVDNLKDEDVILGKFDIA